MAVINPDKPLSDFKVKKTIVLTDKTFEQIGDKEWDNLKFLILNDICFLGLNADGKKIFDPEHEVFHKSQFAIDLYVEAAHKKILPADKAKIDSFLDNIVSIDAGEKAPFATWFNKEIAKPKPDKFPIFSILDGAITDPVVTEVGAAVQEVDGKEQTVGFNVTAEYTVLVDQLRLNLASVVTKTKIQGDGFNVEDGLAAEKPYLSCKDGGEWKPPYGCLKKEYAGILAAPVPGTELIADNLPFKPPILSNIAENAGAWTNKTGGFFIEAKKTESNLAVVLIPDTLDNSNANNNRPEYLKYVHYNDMSNNLPQPPAENSIPGLNFKKAWTILYSITSPPPWHSNARHLKNADLSTFKELKGGNVVQNAGGHQGLVRLSNSTFVEVVDRFCGPDGQWHRVRGLFNQFKEYNPDIESAGAPYDGNLSIEEVQAQQGMTLSSELPNADTNAAALANLSDAVSSNNTGINPGNSSKVYYEGYVLASLIKDAHFRKAPPTVTYESLKDLRPAEELTAPAGGSPVSWWNKDKQIEPWLNRNGDTSETLWKSKYSITVTQTIVSPSSIFGVDALTEEQRKSLSPENGSESISPFASSAANFAVHLQSLKSLGLQAILTYYDKQRDAGTLKNILRFGDTIVKCEDWRYSWPDDPKPMSGVPQDYVFRAKITVPARVLDAIPKNSYSVGNIAEVKNKLKLIKPGSPSAGETANTDPNVPSGNPPQEMKLSDEVIAKLTAVAGLSKYVAFLGTSFAGPGFTGKGSQAQLPAQSANVPPVFVSWLGIKYQIKDILPAHNSGKGYEAGEGSGFTKEIVEGWLNAIGMAGKFEGFLNDNQESAKQYYGNKLKTDNKKKEQDLLAAQAKAAESAVSGDLAALSHYDTVNILARVSLPIENINLNASFSHTTTLNHKNKRKEKLTKDMKYITSRVFKYYQKKLDKLKNKRGQKLEWITQLAQGACLPGPLLLKSKGESIGEDKILHLYREKLLDYLKRNSHDYLLMRDPNLKGIYVGDPAKPTSRDMVELGFDDDFNLTYILFNGTPLTISFGELVTNAPFSYLRTNAFIARAEYIKRDYKKSKKKKLSVSKWCAKHVYPPGELQISGDRPGPDKPPVEKKKKTATDIKKVTIENDKNKRKVNEKAKETYKVLKSVRDFMSDATMVINTLDDAYTKVIDKYGIEALLAEAIRCLYGDAIEDPESFIVEYILTEILGISPDTVDDVEDIIDFFEEVLENIPAECIEGVLKDVVTLKVTEIQDPEEKKKKEEAKKKAREEEEKKYDDMLKSILAGEDKYKPYDPNAPDAPALWQNVTHEVTGLPSFNPEDPLNEGDGAEDPKVWPLPQYSTLNIRSSPSVKSGGLADGEKSDLIPGGNIISSPAPGQLKAGTLLRFLQPKPPGSNGTDGTKGDWYYVQVLGGPNSTIGDHGEMLPGYEQVPGQPDGPGKLKDPWETAHASARTQGWVNKKYIKTYVNPHQETKILIKKGSENFKNGLKDQVTLWADYLRSSKLANSYNPNFKEDTTIAKVSSGAGFRKAQLNQVKKNLKFTAKMEKATIALLGVPHVTNIQMQKALAWFESHSPESVLLSRLEEKWRFPTPYVELGGVSIAPPGFWTKDQKARKKPRKHRACDDLYTQLLKNPDDAGVKAKYFACMQRKKLIVHGESKSYFASKMLTGEKEATLAGHILAQNEGKCKKYMDGLSKVLRKRNGKNGRTTVNEKDQIIWNGTKAEDDELELYAKWQKCVQKSAIEAQEKWVAKSYDEELPTNMDELVAFWKKRSSLPFNTTLSPSLKVNQIPKAIMKNCGDDIRVLLENLLTKIETEPQYENLKDVITTLSAIALPVIPAVEAFAMPKWPKIGATSSDPDADVRKTVLEIFDKMANELILFMIKEIMNDIQKSCKDEDQTPYDPIPTQIPSNLMDQLNDLAENYGLEIPQITDPSQNADPDRVSTYGFTDEENPAEMVINLKNYLDYLRRPAPYGVGRIRLCQLLNGICSVPLFKTVHEITIEVFPAIAKEIQQHLGCQKFFADIGKIVDKSFCFPSDYKLQDESDAEPCEIPFPTSAMPEPTYPFQVGPLTLNRIDEKKKLIEYTNALTDPAENLANKVQDPCKLLPNTAKNSPSYVAAAAAVINSAFDGIGTIFSHEMANFVPMLKQSDVKKSDDLAKVLKTNGPNMGNMLGMALKQAGQDDSIAVNHAKQMQKDLNPKETNVRVYANSKPPKSVDRYYVFNNDLSKVIIDKDAEKGADDKPIGSGENGEFLTYNEALKAGRKKFVKLQGVGGDPAGAAANSNNPIGAFWEGRLWCVGRKRTFDENLSGMKDKIAAAKTRFVARPLRSALRNPLTLTRQENVHKFRLPRTSLDSSMIEYKTGYDTVFSDSYSADISPSANSDIKGNFGETKSISKEVSDYIQTRDLSMPDDFVEGETPKSIVCADYALKHLKESFGNVIENLENSEEVSVIKKNLQPIIAQNIIEKTLETSLRSPMFQIGNLNRLDFSSTTSSLLEGCSKPRNKSSVATALLGFDDFKTKIRENYFDKMDICSPTNTADSGAEGTMNSEIMKSLVRMFIRVELTEGILQNIFLFSQYKVNSGFGDNLVEEYLFEKLKHDLLDLNLYKKFQNKAKEIVQDELGGELPNINPEKSRKRKKKRDRVVTGLECLRYLFEEQYEAASQHFELLLGSSVGDEKDFLFRNMTLGFAVKVAGPKNTSFIMNLVDAQGADEIIDANNGTFASGKEFDSEDLIKRFEQLPGATKTKAALNPRLVTQLERGGFILERFLFVKDKLLDDGTPVLDKTLELFKLPKRPDWTRGYVNLNDWEKWIMSTYSSVLALAGQGNAESAFNALSSPYSEYFEELSTGLRMTYVLANTQPDLALAATQIGSNRVRRLKDEYGENAGSVYIDNTDGYVTDLTKAVDSLIDKSQGQPGAKNDAPLGGLKVYKTLTSRLTVDAESSEELSETLTNLVLAKAFGGGSENLLAQKAYRMFPIMEIKRDILSVPTNPEYKGPGALVAVESSIAGWAKATINYKQNSMEKASHRGHTHSAYAYNLYNMRESLINSSEFKAFFEYAVPVKRYLGLASIYNIAAIRKMSPSGLDLFDGTKRMIRNVYNMSNQGSSYDTSINTGDPMSQSSLSPEDGILNENYQDLGETDADAFWNLMFQMYITTPLKVLKGVVEASDPNIIVSKKIFDGINMAMKVIWELNNQDKNGQVDPCLGGGPPSLPGFVHPILSLFLFPSNIYGVGFPLPPLGPGFGPPLTPMGAAYLGFGLVDSFNSKPIDKCGAKKEEKDLDDCNDIDLVEEETKNLLTNNTLFGSGTKKQKEIDPDT